MIHRDTSEELTQSEHEGLDDDVEEAVHRAMAPYEAAARESLKQLAAEGGLVPVEKLAALLQVSAQELHDAVADSRLFSIEVEGEGLVPAFYADPALERESLERVCKTLGTLSGSSKWQFFTNRRTSLGGATALERLREGEVGQVVASARGFLER